MSRDGGKAHARRATLFLIVGGLGFVIDAVTFNVLVYWNGSGPLFDLPLLAKIIAIGLATVGTYVGNRFLTYRDRTGGSSVRQFAIFAAINVIAILLQLGCLGFSRYVLGLADPVSDNLWGTFIGQGVATVFRYVTYGRWVFREA
ncbi:GtrA family protein [Marisediminicola senii]|uniref:GtrA family protein n=1 Tax=Marisediminicola senii TaxID=2711233 RepID=UPI0022A753C2|nr:GtrA family protein [Marisediminicola senii]